MLTLTRVGLGYGVISGVTAAAVAVHLGARAGRAGGRAAVPGVVRRRHRPADRGRLSDLTQGYGTAIMISAGGNVLGVLVAVGLPRPRTDRGERQAEGDPMRAAQKE